MSVSTPHLSKPTQTFKPRTLTVMGPTRDTTTTRPKGPIYGPEKTGPDGRPLVDARGRPAKEVVGWRQPGKTRVCWDLIIECDGHRWYDRHYAAGHAQAAKELLEAGFRQGLDFDPTTKRFVEPTTSAPSPAVSRPTVFSESLAWWRAHWSTVEPRSRKETLRYICRPIVDLVDKETVAPGGLEEYLSWQMLPPKGAAEIVPEEHVEAALWLAAASLPVEEADVAAWQTYVDRWRINSRTGRPLAQSSLNRHLTDVKQLWAWVCALHHLPNPWPMVQTGTRSSAGGRRSSTVRPVDRTIVLAPQHVRELARLCGQGSFGPLSEVYILLLGIAGGRPGESAGVRTSELDAAAEGIGHVRFHRTDRRGIDPNFLDPDDDTAWGPLKGREIEDSRTVPLPSKDAARIHHLLAERSTGELFGGWDWDKFSRDVWAPAKTLMASLHDPEQAGAAEDRKEAEALRSALARLRLHDLRHAACSMWLNTPGLEFRVACEWSGHRRLSVFLDIYQGIMPGSQIAGETKLDAAWGS